MTIADCIDAATRYTTARSVAGRMADMAADYYQDGSHGSAARLAAKALAVVVLDRPAHKRAREALAHATTLAHQYETTPLDWTPDP